MLSEQERNPEVLAITDSLTGTVEAMTPSQRARLRLTRGYALWGGGRAEETAACYEELAAEGRTEGARATLRQLQPAPATRFAAQRHAAVAAVCDLPEDAAARLRAEARGQIEAQVARIAEPGLRAAFLAHRETRLARGEPLA